MRPRDVEVCIGLTMLGGGGERGGGEGRVVQVPQSDSYAEAHAIRNEKRAVLTSELNIPLVRMPNLSAASSYCGAVV